MLADICKKQEELMARLGVKILEKNNANVLLIQEQTRDLLFALCCELGETADEINWKPWKKTKKQINLSALKTELIDILHFTLELCLMWGMDAKEIHACYLTKMAENHARQERGY